MPPLLPVLRARLVVRAFERLGWVHTRTTGSHLIFHKEGNPSVLSIPNHPRQDIKPGLLKGLLRTADVSDEEFLAALRGR
ncbi:MAG: type II toxin-antitoxin system HicA family toxin [Candidatus Poribacteria bacterium]|nr:type II toxin-antitoxin system HicA family toxin [Candidatus Poribacteria bacterium]